MQAAHNRIDYLERLVMVDPQWSFCINALAPRSKLY
jgi:hypothetical protein